MSRPVDPIYVYVGQAVREHRDRCGFAQQELADAVGLTRTSITNLEQGRQQTPLHVLCRVADHLGVALKDLLPDTQDHTHHRGADLGQEDIARFREMLSSPGRKKR